LILRQKNKKTLSPHTKKDGAAPGGVKKKNSFSTKEEMTEGCGRGRGIKNPTRGHRVLKFSHEVGKRARRSLEIKGSGLWDWWTNNSNEG